MRQEDAFTGILGLFASDLDQQQLLAFSDLFLNGCFLWHELTTVTSVDAAVLAMLSGDLRVASQSVVDSFFLTQQEVDDEEIAAVQLTEREQTILRLLARGITEDAIAQELGRSRRTIERAVHDLQETLQAPDLFVLGMRAAQLRLVP